MPNSTHPGYRIYVLGAGFSRLANLPLATELFPLVRQCIESKHGKDTKFERDIRRYRTYCMECGIGEQSENGLNLELFMSYLDIEHFLRLRGSDTWSSEGNETQLMVRRAIGEIIHRRTPAEDRLPAAYYRFAENLSLNDKVVSLNYDLVLERALTHVGKPFRRYPYRFESLSPSGGYVDTDINEVVLLKLHGSVDWFDDRQFLKSQEHFKALGIDQLPKHSVFEDITRFDSKPLVDSLLPDTDQLRHIHAIGRVDDYYNDRGGFNAPFILAPSGVKFVYAEPLVSFWDGMGQAGAYNLGISIVGFSLPEHDEYIRVVLHQMLSNYYWRWDEPEFQGLKKDFVRFVDFRSSSKEKEAFRKCYKFANSAQSHFFFEGFGAKAIDFLFHQRREN